MIRNKTQRKTIGVKTIQEEINRLLALDTLSEEKKSVLCHLIEEVLMSTHNYRGFNYIDWINKGYKQWEIDGKPKDTTPYLGREYSRVYFI